jgi:NADPH-dependent ferric siderophore reductase
MISELPTPHAHLAVTRVRHPLKIRLVEVLRIAPLTPHLIRITLGGDDLRGFVSASFDDHVKVFFPAPGAAKPVLPVVGPDGPSHDPGAVPAVMRDFTPRRFDPVAGELDIEFVLHDSGPATTWAAQARVGQYLGIGGPRGSMIIPTGFDWHLLIGDDTALPAMARRLEELPRVARSIVIAEVAGSYAQVDFKSHSQMQVIWCHRGEAPHRDAAPGAAAHGSLLASLTALPPLPTGEGYAWVAAESSVVRQIRVHLLSQRGLHKSRIRAAAYWKRGAEAMHEVIDD